jgi:hypothetical protein
MRQTLVGEPQVFAPVASHVRVLLVALVLLVVLAVAVLAATSTATFTAALVALVAAGGLRVLLVTRDTQTTIPVVSLLDHTAVAAVALRSQELRTSRGLLPERGTAQLLKGEGCEYFVSV